MWHSQKRKRDSQGLVLIGLSSLVILGLISASIALRDTQRYDPLTLCPLNQDFARTIILIDQTDPLTDNQHRFLRNLAGRIKTDLRRFEKLSIYLLDDKNYYGAEPVFELCNPGTGADANELYQNPRLIQLKYEEQFGEPLDAIFDRLPRDRTAEHSPILEMIKAVSLSEDLTNTETPTRLIILSDMLQNVPDYSHYKLPKMDFQRFRNSSYARRNRTDLGGATIIIVYLLRPGIKRQGNDHIQFWLDTFSISNARVLEVRQIQ